MRAHGTKIGKPLIKSGFSNRYLLRTKLGLDEADETVLETATENLEEKIEEVAEEITEKDTSELGSLEERTQGLNSKNFAEDFLSNAIGERSAANRSASSTAGDTLVNTMQNNFGIAAMSGDDFLKHVAPSIAGQAQPLGKPIILMRDGGLIIGSRGVMSRRVYCKRC